MDKEALKKVVLEILGSENEEPFSEFLKNIADHLQGGKTLKLNGIGHFQLKKEPLSRMERRGEGSFVGNDILIFLPENEISEEKLLSFKVDNVDTNNEDFADSVFDIGVNRKTIIPDSVSDDEDYDRKILKLIESGEIFEDFDILNNPFPSIESDGINSEQIEFSADKIIDDEIEEKIIEEIDDSQLDEKVTVGEINRNFLSDSEVEKLEEQLAEKDMEIEENEFEDEQHKSNYEEISSNAKAKMIFEDVSESVSGIPDEEDNFEEIEEEEVTMSHEDKNPFDELDDYIKEETNGEVKEALNENTNESFNIEIPEATSDNDTNEKGETEMKHSSYSELRNKSNEWYKSPALIIGIIAAAIVAFTIFYFWPSLTKSTHDETAQLNSGQGIIDSLEAGDTTKIIIDEKAEDEQTTRKNPADIQRDKSRVENATKPVSRVGTTAMYRDIPNDKAVAERIFFDGKKYTVQSSSWKSPKIAEQEVSKLKKRGFDAFVFKVFIESKAGTWNRVRIGYFNSRTEAEEFLKKNKI